MTTKTQIKEEKNTTTGRNLMLVKKVKLLNDGTAEINYSTSKDDAAETVFFKGKEEVTKDFKSVFQATVEGFLGCIPLLEKDAGKITMNVISLDYGKGEFLERALYSVKYAFNSANNAVINISTPLLPIYKEGMENTFTISGKHEEALHNVIAEAKAYIKGKTATKQMKLVIDNT